MKIYFLKENSRNEVDISFYSFYYEKNNLSAVYLFFLSEILWRFQMIFDVAS